MKLLKMLVFVVLGVGSQCELASQVLMGGSDGGSGGGGGGSPLILGQYACTFTAENSKVCAHSLNSAAVFIGAIRPTSGADIAPGSASYTPVDVNSGTVAFAAGYSFTGTVYLYGGLGSGIPAGSVSPGSIAPSGTDLQWLRSVSGSVVWATLDAAAVPFSISGTNFPGGSGVTNLRNALTYLWDNKVTNTITLVGGVGIGTIGDLTTNRTINVDFTTLSTVTTLTANEDYMMVYIPDLAGHRRIRFDDLITTLGLTGGGTSMSVNIDGGTAETGITELNLLSTTNLGISGNRVGNRLDVTLTASPVVSYGVNSQTGTTYIVLDSDEGKLVTFNNGSAIAVTLPQAGASSEFLSTWAACFSNYGAGTATITPTTSTINGAASVVLGQGQSTCVWSNGTNYFRTATAGGSSAPTDTISNTEIIKDSFLSGRNGNGVGGEMPWTFGGTHAFVPVSGVPGVKRLSTGASINTVAYMSSSDSAQTSFDIADVGEILYRIRLSQVDADTTARIGLACQSHTVAQPTAGLWFERAGGDTNWQRVARAASTETKQDTGVAATTSWAWFRIRPKGSGVIGFAMNGGAETDISTGNVPTGGCNFWVMITNTAAADKSMDIDYFQAKFTVSRSPGW